METSNKIKLFLIILPVILYILAIILINDIIFSHKADVNFIYADGKISGSRWFSYKYSSNKYFREKDSSLSNRYITKSDALQQVSVISKAREYSTKEINLLYNIIDSFSRISNRNINNEKEIEIMILNIALDDINQ
ncbi:MAG: potassium-transporting ATPase subunit C [Ignavibacteria bacterium]